MHSKLKPRPKFSSSKQLPQVPTTSNKQRNKAQQDQIAATLRSKEKADVRKIKKEFKKSQHRKSRDYTSSEERAFVAKLASIGLRVKVMEGDGNCMFRTIADQLTGNPDDHMRYREVIVDHIEKNSEHFKLFIEDDEPFEDYVDRMRSFGEWGGHPELYAAAQSLALNIFVYRAEDVEQEPYAITCDVKAIHVLHLSYHGDCHYNSIRLAQDIGEGPAVVIDIDRIREKYNISAATSSPSSDCISHVDQVLRALPWIKRPVAEFALEMSDDVVDDAIEILMSNPNLKVCP